MEMYARYYGDYDFPISTLLWGALIFVALVASWILAGKAIGWLRNRRKFDGGAVEGGHTKDQFAETLAEIWHSDQLIDKTRKQRKAKAREKAQKHQNKS